ncbi:hypothetical protein F6455_00455 [Proteobacteria bacterium 005FR1]|nr:hypothetical protein [Proteobacteria bacterium 005FR1]
MHLRKLTFTVGLVGALCSTWAHSLGLGEIKLNSSLNQPLDAEIKLLQVRNLTEEDILVTLAKAEDFQRFGVDRIFFLQNLKFDVQLDNPAGPLVRVTTDEPVREPFLIFLLEAESPQGGRLLREYTLLLDLPVFADQPAQPVQGAQSQQARAPQTQTRTPQAQVAQSQSQAPAPQPQQAQGAEEPPRAQPAPERSVSSRAGIDVYGPVQPNDTLWEIAERVRPNSGISVQQSMLALQRANPEAFIDGNINLLKRGQVLRIPTEGEFASVDRGSAVTEVAYQNERWSAARRGEVTGAELQASSSRPSVANQSQAPRGQLTIAAPGVTDSAGERSGAGDDSAEVEALENELALTADELNATQRENAELSARVAELEEQIATMERLIEVSNEELRAMQLAAEQGQQGDAAADLLAETEAVEPLNTPTVATDAEVQPAVAAAEPAPQPGAQPERMVVTQSLPQPTLVDQLMANLWYLLGGLFAVLGGVAYLLHRRRQQEEEADVYETALEDNMFAQEQTDYAAESDDFANAEFAEAMELGDDEPAAFEDSAELVESVEPETGDAVGEADIYIAYGKYDQAEEMLQKAIAREPENLDARLKLLEVYSETRNAEKFDLEYGQLMALGDAAATARAGELRSAIPGVEEYAGALPTQESQVDEQEFSLADDGIDFDTALEASDDELSLEGESSETADAAQSGASDFGDLSLDLDDSEGESDDNGFDLDLSLEASEDEESEESDGFDFALDLELEGEDVSTEESEGDDAEDQLSLDGDNELIAFDTKPTAPEAEKDDFDFSEFELDGVTEQRESTSTDAEEDGLEFDLDLDASSLELAAEEGSESDSNDPLNDLDFADLELEKPESGGELDLELDIGEDFTLESGSEAAQPTSAAAAEEDEDDIFSDLEFSAAEEDDAAELKGTTNELDDLEFSQPKEAKLDQSEADEADDFDLDMGDLDLEALDQEMDALVGKVDDLGDDDVALATPTETLSALDEKTMAASSARADADADAEIEFDLDDLVARDLDELELASESPESEDWSLEDLAPAKAGNEEVELESFAFGEDQAVEDEETDDLDTELDFLSDADEVATKLDLARAYIDMGDQDGARDILDEVKSEGSDEQKREAEELLEKI